LLTIALKGLIKKNPGLDLSAIDDVIIGCANQAGEDNRNVARMSLLMASMPISVPGER
jgi:acetyl-CoA acetyltransferase